MTSESTAPQDATCDATDSSKQSVFPMEPTNGDEVFYHTPSYFKNRVALLPSIKKYLALYGASVLAMFVFLPILATLATVTFYFAPFGLLSVYASWQAPLYGLVSALVVTLVIAIFRFPSATAEGANIDGYNMLRSGQIELSARLGVFRGGPFSISQQQVRDAFQVVYLGRQSIAALQEAYVAFNAISESLSTNNGTQWAKGTGYVYTWGLIHRAEEALVEADDLAIVIREAMRDRLELEGSRIENRDNLLKELQLAVEDLDPSAVKYFKDPQSDTRFAMILEEVQNLRSSVGAQKHETVHGATHEKPDITDRFGQDELPGQEKRASSLVEARARASLRQVKHGLNKFREDRLAELIQARNNLVLSIIASGSITYILLLMTILSKPPLSIMAGAVAYYIVGVAIGLFGRLYNESISTSATNDYGLSLSRLTAVPLLSGLAAIGGVFLIAALPAALPNAHGPVNLSLTNIFIITPYYLLIAAVFGFTPNLLIKTLQTRSDKIVADLESTKSGGGISSGK